MTTQISNSEIQTWKDCRRKWWFVYHRELGLKQKSVTGPLAFGTRMHTALQYLYEGREDPLGWLKESFKTDYENAAASGEYLEEDLKKLEKEWEMAIIMFEGFLTWSTDTGLDWNYELLGAEEVIEVPSHIPGVTLRAKMDQRVKRRSDGARLFRDWKTAAGFDAIKTLHMDEQMLFYHMLDWIEGEGQQRVDGALYVILKKGMQTARATPPFYKEHTVHHNMAEIQSMWKRTSKVVEEIVQADQQLAAGADPLYVVPPRPSRDCTWKCPFFQVCPMADDGSDLEGALEEYYEHLDPHKRYEAEERKGDDA